MDIVLATRLLKELHRALPKEDSDTVIEAVKTYRGTSRTEEDVARVVNVVKPRLMGYPDLLKMFDHLIPSSDVVGGGTEAMEDRADPSGNQDVGPSSGGIGGCLSDDKTDGRIPSHQAPVDRSRSQTLQQSRDAFDRLMAEVQDDGAMSEFMTVLTAYDSRTVTGSEALDLVPSAVRDANSFKAHFESLFEIRGESGGRSHRSPRPRLSQAVSDALSRIQLKRTKLEKCLNSAHKYKALVEPMKKYATGRADLMWLKAVLLAEVKDESRTVWNALQEFNLELDRIRSMGEADKKDFMTELLVLLETKRHRSANPVEIRSNQSPRCTPSYVHISNSLDLQATPSRSPLARSVLNDTLQSITGGLEGTETQCRHNISEQKMAEMETEIWNAELTIYRYNSLKKHLETLLGEIEDRPIDEVVKKIRKEGLTKKAIHQSVLSDLYKENLEEMSDAVRQSPVVGIKVLIESVDHKLQEWEEGIANQAPIWKETCLRHHRRSLDYTCQVFQDNEKKELSLRSQMTEINRKVKAETKTKGTIVYVHLLDQIRRPHLAYDFDNREALRLCGWGITEGITIWHGAIDADAAMQFWKAFLRLFLGMGRSVRFSDVDQQSSATNTNSTGRSVGSLTGIPQAVGQSAAGRRAMHGFNLLYCDNAFYHLFRLLHVLHQRFLAFIQLSHTQTVSEQTIKELLLESMTKKADPIVFEDRLCRLLGNDSYPLFTLPDLIRDIVISMNKLTNSQVLELFDREVERSTTSTLDSIERSEFLKRRAEWPHSDDGTYFAEAAQKLKPDVFRIVFDCSKRRLSIRKVTEDAEKLPRLTSVLRRPINSPKPVTPIFLKRNHAAVTSKGSQWPRYIYCDQLKRTGESGTFKFRSGTEFWLLSTSRGKRSNAGIVEKKSIAMRRWLKRTEHKRF